MLRIRLVLVAALLLTLACAGKSFNAARSQDTAAAYHRFLREYPDSEHAEEAQQRLALARMRTKPTAEGWDDFVERWPGSSVLPDVRPVVEQKVFERARATGTVAAYRAFLEDFADGGFAERARGNLAYLEAQGFRGRPDELAAFAEAHPESDYAAEAARTASSLAVRNGSAFERVGLVVSFASSSPGKQRLARVFTERAAESLGSVGVKVLPLSGASDPRGKDLPVRLTIHHEEAAVGTRLAQGTMSSGGVLAETTVTLARSGEDQPIWSRTTQFRAPAPSSLPDTSVLFGPGSKAFWSSFFVPVATWNTRVAVRNPTGLERRVAAVETVGSRGFVLFEDGSFTLFDLSDPERPWPFATYERPRDLASFDGLRVAEDRAVVFGEDGIEIVSLAGGPKRVRALDRGTLGSVLAVEPLASGLVVAGQRGLVFVPEGQPPEVLVDRPIRGMARSGDRIVFTDGSTVYVSTLPLLRKGRVEGDLELGPGVRPSTIRAGGRVVVVLSDVGALRLDLRKPSSPRLASRIEAARVGPLRDAAVAGGRIFLLGERGLQVSDPRAVRVVQSVDVAARTGFDRMGRHLVMVGDDVLQVVDTTPFVASRAASAAK
ncbi:MAG: hypothetical protein QNK04_24200 [Myxococcota bacterium]|nr:hypothetical protein [Myxococcota bacterium]